MTIEGDISFQNLQNFWVARKLISPYILCKILINCEDEEQLPKKPVGRLLADCRSSVG